MKTIAGSALVLCATVCMAASAAAQTPVGALAIDERQGDQYGWAVDYETAGSAQAAALRECGVRCSVVLTFERCAAYAAEQDADSTAVGWASRGGGVEDGLGLDRVARRQVQEGLQATGFDLGGADGMFGPRTRSAIRRWQTSRGARAMGYLDGASVAALRPAVAGQPTFREREPAGTAASSAATAAPPAVSAAQQQSPPASAELEGLFWQSIVNSTDPADFEAYLEAFPNGGVPAAGREPVGGAALAGRQCARVGGASCWRRGLTGLRLSGVRRQGRGVRGRGRR